MIKKKLSRASYAFIAHWNYLRMPCSWVCQFVEEQNQFRRCDCNLRYRGKLEIKSSVSSRSLCLLFAEQDMFLRSTTKTANRRPRNCISCRVLWMHSNNKCFWTKFIYSLVNLLKSDMDEQSTVTGLWKEIWELDRGFGGFKLSFVHWDSNVTAHACDRLCMCEASLRVEPCGVLVKLFSSMFPCLLTVAEID